MFGLNEKMERLTSGASFAECDMEIEAFGASDRGEKRGENEDSFLIWRIGGVPGSKAGEAGEILLAAADGLGRDRRGQIASRLAVETLRKVFSFPSYLPPGARLANGLEIINRRIFNLAKHDSLLRGMATTLTVVYIKDATAYIANIGNSRAYLIRQGEIRQLTKDHTLAQILLENGYADRRDISERACKTLLQAVGNDFSVEIWQTSIDLAPDDLILVCSDGLTAEMADEELRRIVNDHAAGPEAAVRRLIDRANALGGKDNITAIVAGVKQIARKISPVSAGINDPLICKAV
ncbi:MAG: protein phosphatase 2C domain-containing protein [Pyrinomonadaceae bacterium]